MCEVEYDRVLLCHRLYGTIILSDRYLCIAKSKESRGRMASVDDGSQLVVIV